MMNFFKAGAVILFAGILSLGAVQAQAQTRVDDNKDWSIFEAGAAGQKICWIVSRPTSSLAYRGGKRVEVNRSDIFMMISMRQADGVVNEVSFLGGYPFKPGSKVEVMVGSEKFTMFTEGENAWAPSPKDDGLLVNAFRRGTNATIEGISARGTKTVDTFSLSGFTASLDSATNLCK